MPTYSEPDFKRIAAAIGRPAAEVTRHASRFEAAAQWFRIDQGIGFDGEEPPSRPPPLRRARRMEQLARSARRYRKNLLAEKRRPGAPEASLQRLLTDLAIDDASEIPDGPQDPDIFELLTYPAGSDQGRVLDLLSRLDRTEAAERIAAAEELEKLAMEAAAAALALGSATVPKGHIGNRAINCWVATMLGLYRDITGREPATSVDASSGVAGGALIQFLAAAAKPAGITDRNGQEFNEDAWRSRVRTVLAGA